MPNLMEELPPNELASMISQRQRMMGPQFGAGLPAPMPTGQQPPQQSPQQSPQQQPDLTAHVYHIAGAPEGQNDPRIPSPVAPNLAPSPVVEQQPLPKTGPLDPHTDNPREEAYQQAISQEPMHSDYHPSKLRKVLSTIGGMSVGAFQGPQAGANFLQGARDAPYLQRHADWAQYAGNRGKLATEEAAMHTQGQKDLTDAALMAEHYATAGKAAAETPPNYQTYVDNLENIRRAGVASALPGDYQLLMKDGSKKWAIEDPMTGKLYEKDSTQPSGRGALISSDTYTKKSEKGKSIDQTPKNENPFNAYMEGILDRDPTMPKDQIAKDWLAEQVKRDPKVKQEFDTFYAGEKLSHPNLKDEDIVAKYAALPRPIPGQLVFQQTDSGIKPIGARAGGPELPKNIQTASGVSQGNTASPLTRSRGEAADVAIKGGAMLKDWLIANKDKLGKIGDYWDAIKNDTPIADPVYSEAKSRIASLAAYQGAAHSVRAATMMHEWEQRFGGPVKNVDAIISAIDGTSDELTAARDEAKSVTGGGSGGDDTASALAAARAEIERRKKSKK